MNAQPVPVVFTPLFKPKPWGGRRLARTLGKTLPGTEPIGESWELVSLPGCESRVRGGPLDGAALSDLVAQWGSALLGAAGLADGRFPLLIKFLDARENLSVQCHPRPSSPESLPQPGVKHECWYVVAAEPGSRLYAGLRPGVEPAAVARAARTRGLVDLMQPWEARAGDVFYLPSGTLHSLGAGLMVAEVQTPSDVTYRAYDWDRGDPDGRPRELHVEAVLANTRYDVTADMISQPRVTVPGPLGRALRVASCSRFEMRAMTLPAGAGGELPEGQMRIWIVLAGHGTLAAGGVARHRCGFVRGDVVLIPAGDWVEVRVEEAADLVEVTVPTPWAEKTGTQLV